MSIYHWWHQTRVIHLKRHHENIFEVTFLLIDANCFSEKWFEPLALGCSWHVPAGQGYHGGCNCPDAKIGARTPGNMKNKTKWELSELVSSRSLDERTDVENQVNGLSLTSWCRHHNTVLGSKRCIRRAQCHQDILWQYGFLSAFSCTGSTKFAPGLTFRWWIGEMHPVHQICMQDPHCQVPSVARHLIGSDMISYL